MGTLTNILHRSKRYASREDGLTLVELTLVATFSIFVIILAYQLVQFANTGTREVNRNAAVTGDAGVVLDIVDRYLSQNTEFTISDPYTFTLTIPGKSGAADYHVTFASAADGTLTMTRDLNGANEQLLLSSLNANRSSATPFFRFYSETGRLLPAGTMPENITDVRAVKITIVAKTPNRTGEGYSYLNSSRTVYFRNR